jgi:hypothetical protein
MRDLTARVRKVYDARQVTILLITIIVVVVVGLAEAARSRSQLAAQARRITALSCEGAVESRALQLGFVDALVAAAQRTRNPAENGERAEQAERYRASEHARIVGAGVPPQCEGVMWRREYLDAIDEAVERQRQRSADRAAALNR